MSRTRTMPHDYNRQVAPNETERKIEALPPAWFIRCKNLYVTIPPRMTAAQALLQVESEMSMDDECNHFLPEQTCSRCVPACKTDVELPYQEM